MSSITNYEEELSKNKYLLEQVAKLEFVPDLRSKVYWDLVLPKGVKDASSVYNNPTTISDVVYGNIGTMTSEQISNITLLTKWIYGPINVSFSTTLYDYAIFTIFNNRIFEDVAAIIHEYKNLLNRPFLFVHKDVNDLNANDLAKAKPNIKQSDITMFFDNAVFATKSLYASSPVYAHQRLLNKIYLYTKTH